MKTIKIFFILICITVGIIDLTYGSYNGKKMAESFFKESFEVSTSLSLKQDGNIYTINDTDSRYQNLQLRMGDIFSHMKEGAPPRKKGARREVIVISFYTQDVAEYIMTLSFDKSVNIIYIDLTDNNFQYSENYYFDINYISDFIESFQQASKK